jgi:hypothetical protein
MSITTTTRSAGPFAGDGTITVLPFGFKVFTAGDLKVERTSALGAVSVLALSTHYTVTLNVDQDIAPGGSVVLLTPLAVGERAVLTSDVDATQPLQIRNGGPFLARAVEEALDRQMIVLQQLGGALDRSVRGPSLDVLDELPPAAERALRVLSFDSEGQPVASIPASGSAADVVLDLAGTGTGRGASMVGYKAPGTGAVSRTAQQRLAESVSALDFGAVGDWNGTTGTNNSPWINAALAACTAAGGGTVTLPAGAYYCASGVGSDVNDLGSWHENVQIVGAGIGSTVLVFDAAYSGVCLGLNGNNVAVRDLTVKSTRALDHRADLTAQRVVYQLGIWVGSKNNIGTLATYRTGAEVSRCQVLDMNLPIVANMAGSVRIHDCQIDRFTDTGIIVDNPSTDVWIARNKITNGGDDHIFCRHYANSPWAVAGKYSGRLFIVDNVCHDTFGKNIGVGGLGDVLISNNWCSLSWAGGINFEKDDWYKTNPANYRNLVICDNTIVDAGRNFHTSEPVAAHRVAFAGQNPSAIHCVYLNTDSAINWADVSVSRNKIVNPYRDGVAISAADFVTVAGNTFSAGFTNHGAGLVETQGAGVYADSCSGLRVRANEFISIGGALFQNCYALAAGSGFSDAVISGGFEACRGDVLAFADAGAKAATWARLEQKAGPSADRGDSGVTLNARVDDAVQRFATTLTAPRAVVLQTAGAVRGDIFRVVRTAGGAHGLDVGGVKTLAAGQWVDVIFEGSAWVINGFGSL